MKSRAKKRLSLTQQRSALGVLFTLPFTLGFLLFFLYPFFQSILFSVSELRITQQGFELTFVGLKNYLHALTVHPTFVRVFVETIFRMVADVPLILVFSFFSALLLNQEFKGRWAARVIFFLPVIMGAGIILTMEQTDYMMLLQSGPVADPTAISGEALRDFLFQMRLPEQVLNYVVGAVERIPMIIRASGIQILIFLAGLQSISPVLFEAADVEGATKWESFWMITFPMMGPLILTNVVYSIIDSFTAPHNELVVLIRTTAFGGAGYGVSLAMSWVYFMSILAVLAVTIRIISKNIFYHE